MSEIEDRRQRAREAYDDALTESAHGAGWPTARGWAERSQEAREAAIEAATRVQITPEVIAEAYPNLLPSETPRAVACLTNALTALGFEVIE